MSGGLIGAVLLTVVIFAVGISVLEQATVQGQSVTPFRSAYDERLNTLDREALEIAYRNQIVFLFQVWMKDSAHQPQRALLGTNQARRAYVDAMTELDRRRP